MQIPGWSPDTHWLNGILITNNEDKTKVLLQSESGTQIKLRFFFLPLNFSSNLLFIHPFLSHRLDGDEKSSSHFSAMTENMDVLFTEKLKIPMTVKVPCSHCLLLDDPKPYSFSLRECQVYYYLLLFIIYYLLFIIYYLLFIIYYLLFIIYYLLFIIYYLLFIIYYLLFIIYYLLFIIYYLLFIILISIYSCFFLL